VLINQQSPVADVAEQQMQEAGRTLRVQLRVFHASTDRELETVFAELNATGLVIIGDPFFNSRSEQLAALASRYMVPAVYQFREFTTAGGLMSYGSSLLDAHRLTGSYIGRVLKGDAPANLPVQQSTKLELIINTNTAKALGLTVPLTLLGRADEVVE
jgi:putative ABC transport system substrate-binding protein